MQDPPRRGGAGRGATPARADARAALARHPLVTRASTITEELLGGNTSRLQHCRGVAARAMEVSPAVSIEDGPVLVAAAWLHDIGYADGLKQGGSGFHPLDGARYLMRTGWGGLVAGLVAHHSGALYTAVARGLSDELAAFDHPRCWTGPLAEALTTADQTTAPDGRPIDVEDRLADMLRRHGPASPQAQVHDLRAPVIRDAVAHTELRLRLAGGPPGRPSAV